MGEPKQPRPRFRNAPVVEAVVDIDCDLQPGFELGAVQDAAREALGPSYPTLQIKRRDEFRFEASEAGTESRPVRSGLDALQFFSPEGEELVQVRHNGFSFNRLRPYTCLDDLLPKIERVFAMYRTIAEPIKVTTVRLRYINRIELPFEEGKVEIDDYVNIGPRLPIGADLGLGPFLIQFMVRDEDSRCTANVRLAAEQPSKEILPLILDIEAFRVGDADAKDWSTIEQQIQALREFKNDIFFGSITEKTERMYE